MSFNDVIVAQIVAQASSRNHKNTVFVGCRSGGIGRRGGFKIRFPQGSGGSSPFSGTIFPQEKDISDSTERLLNARNPSSGTKGPFIPVNKIANICDETRMYMPFVVTYENFEARIVFAPSDQRFHASWKVGGIRRKTSAKTLEEAANKATEKLKLCAQGSFEFASCTQRDCAKITSAITLLTESGYPDLLNVALEYLELKQKANEILNSERAETSKEGVDFALAADQWFNFKKPGWSDVHADAVRSRLERVKGCLEMGITDIDHSVISVFFEQFSDRKPKTRNHFREILKGVFSFSFDRGWVTTDQFERLRRILTNESAPAESPQILASSEFRLLLELAAKTEILPIIAIAGFTGARQAEILRLKWSHIWARRDHVELEAHLTKTRRRRLVPRLPALEAWLQNYRNATGPIWPDTVKSYQAKYYRLMKKAKIKGNNLLRHSYASYRFTQIGENELAKELGNSPGVIFSNYRELVEPEAAEDWFSIVPDNKG